MRHFLFLLSAAALLAACKSEPATQVPTPYSEQFRPQYHFTPPAGWMNDPNGMVYYEGEYHLFYQHYPDSTVWGPMHWGHAVSTDMVHWQHLPIALYPDSLGYIFSGSAVVDWKNTSGFGTASTPPLVAIYTYHNMAIEKSGGIKTQSQGIAYSVDKGRTWTKYEHNPVLPNPGIRDFRDPKVSWVEKSGLWTMALAVQDHIEFYGSPNLKDWKKLSEFGKDLGHHGGVWECPDLFPLQDAEGNTHWVLFVSINPGGPQGGSATQYFIGDFDGTTFKSQDATTRWIDYGADNYAGVTWSDIPAADGRRLFLGWMSNWQYANVVPTASWRSASTLPREITLRKSATGHELVFAPARELNTILGEPMKFSGTANLDTALFEVALGGGDFELTLSNEAGQQTVVSLQGGVLSVDRTASGQVHFSKEFPALHRMDVSSLTVKSARIFADVASLEIFVNDGERVMTEIVFPDQPYHMIKLQQADPAFTVRPVRRTW